MLQALINVFNTGSHIYQDGFFIEIVSSTEYKVKFNVNKSLRKRDDVPSAHITKEF